MNSLKFWKRSAERAVKTSAQTAVALLTAGELIWNIEWTEVIGVSATAGLISVLTSIASLPVGPSENPGLIE